MNYTGTYIDEEGNSKTITITEDDSRVALKNDTEELKRRFNPTRVSIKEVMRKPGEAARIEITVHAKTDYLSSGIDVTPKECDSMTATMICYPGYPVVKMKAFYPSDHYLASLNVFASGDACIDEWKITTSSLLTVADKLVRDMVHDPNVTREDSRANSKLQSWYTENKNAGRFPTIHPKLLYAPELTALPPRKVTVKPVTAPPPLPGRHH